jgi:hypothetical protein
MAPRIQKLRTETGQPIETLREGDDAYRAVRNLYRYGRTYPDKPPHDAPRETTPKYRAGTCSPNDEPASYRQAIRKEAVTPALSEQPPQFPDDKHGAAYDNDASGWVRGMGGQSPHPKFDSGPSHRNVTKLPIRRVVDLQDKIALFVAERYGAAAIRAVGHNTKMFDPITCAQAAGLLFVLNYHSHLNSLLSPPLHRHAF